ncbi:MAG TPA: hypothetical protein DCZ55_32005 [Cyanobacteria bacterium UBA11371]|nr:hypothetical protein [Cyanobacteria bacterium UBA11371]
MPVAVYWLFADKSIVSGFLNFLAAGSRARQNLSILVIVESLYFTCKPLTWEEHFLSQTRIATVASQSGLLRLVLIRGLLVRPASPIFLLFP